MTNLPRLKEAQSIEEFLGALIRSTLDSYAGMWEMEAKRATEADLTGPPIDNATDLVAYIRDPENVTYTVPAYEEPPVPGSVTPP